MTSSAFSSDWIKQFSDPYAVLGVAVTADERRIAKCYRQVAKQLHPDQQSDADESTREFAGQMLTRLVNPSYQRIKQDKGRAETLATLRFKVRRLTREQKLVARGDFAKQLMAADDAAVEVFYEKFLADLAKDQYVSAEAFAKQTDAIAELNLTYLRRKMGDPIIREKRRGILPTNKLDQSVATLDSEFNLAEPAADDSKGVDYAQRHISRAKAYIANKSYTQAIQELRDAVRIDPKNSNYHSMLGQAYLLQKMAGMSKVHFRQALRLDPNNLTALKYAKKLEIDPKQLAAKRATQQPGHHAQSQSTKSSNQTSVSDRNGVAKKDDFFSFFTFGSSQNSKANYRRGWFFNLFRRHSSRK